MINKSIRKNSLYYLINNCLNVIFPFVTSIYVSHVLLPIEIGKVAYAQNIVQYFVILAFLGIPTYGLREISRVRNDIEKLNALFTELFLINLISTALFTITYFLLIFSIKGFQDDLLLYVITGFSIIINSINVSWLYEGLEEFKFISIRNTVFKLISFILLIAFVNNTDDYLIYALITVFGTTGNYILNMFRSTRFVKFTFSNLNIKRHLKSIMLLVVVNLAIEVYTLVDVTMIGLFCSKIDVAFYSYGSKMNKILLQILHTFTMVVVPRLSHYYSNKKLYEYNNLLSKTLLIIIILSVPAIIGLQFYSDYAVCLLFGEQYIYASYVLKILSIVLIISPIGYLLGSRVMLVVGKEKWMGICVGIGALVNIILNYFLIKEFNEQGAAIASVISEVVVAIVYIYFSRKYFTLGNITPSILKITFASALLFVYLRIINNYIQDQLISLLCGIFGGIIVYFIVLFLLKEEIVFSEISNFKRNNSHE